MSFQAYLDNVKAKTGKTPEDFAVLAAQRGLSRHGEVVAWLKDQFGLGHGHATAVAGVILKAGQPRSTASQRWDALFPGKKAHWRGATDRLAEQVRAFGSDVDLQAGKTYISLLRGERKFAIVQPSSADRLDLGVKLKGRAPEGRFEPAGSWNAMVTHRVRIADAMQIDEEVLAWLRQAYAAA